MKLKKISMMTLAALYAAGAGSISASPVTQGQSVNGIKAVKITPEILAQAQEKQYHPALEQALRPGQSGVNVHRALQSGSAKVPFQWEKDIDGEQTYIIQLIDAPVALYQGGIAGFEATSPRSQQPNMRSNQRYGALNASSPAIKNYRQFLNERQDTVAEEIRSLAPQAEIKRRFNLALNGMTMRLTQEQAAEIAKLSSVKAIARAKKYELFTDVGPKHIGADKIWQGQGVPSNVPMRGEGIIAGIIDTGINSDHPSFAAEAADGYQHINPLGNGKYVGDCVESPAMCNNKLIGIRSYDIITDTYKDPLFQPDLPESDVDYKRAPTGEDYNGHGSHTAGTVAGNLLYNVPYKLSEPKEQGDGFNTPLVFPEVSGVAPRANVIAYQVCFPGDGSFGEEFGGCPGDALVAAIEDAILDGVDVINFSIGGLESLPWHDAIEMAFLAAREAGISVAASAGNWGQYGDGYIDHVSPWLTSVAASTHGRKIEPVAGKLANFVGENAPNEINGHGITGNFKGTVVNAADFGDELCNEPFPEDTFEANQIVLCKRGGIARVDKGVNVAAGGAGAVILYNATKFDDGTGANSLNLNAFPIPGLHVDFDAGQDLVTWVSTTPSNEASIYASEITIEERQADVLANFSSRGPSRTNPNVMVPNVSAPGVDVFAAYADEMPFSKYPSTSDYVAISGTSMSGPHVAGALALLTQAHPEWTPAMIQSALMMTAGAGKTPGHSSSVEQTLLDSSFYEMGSGVINLERAVKAGLVLDENGDNYRAANPAEGGDVTALNVPYLANANCQGTCTWMRTFTATEDGEWQADTEVLTAEGAPFLQLDVYPKSFSVRAGQTLSIMVTAKILDVESVNASSAFNEVFGKLVLTPTNNSALPQQHLPVMARFSGSNLPRIVSGQIHRDTGSMLTPELLSKEINSLNIKVSGLVPGELKTHALAFPDAYSFKDPETLMNNKGINVQFFDIPEGTKRVVWEQVSEQKGMVTSLDIGMDLNNNGLVEWFDEAICYSFTDVQEYCAINDPVPGRYWVMVGNYQRNHYDEPDIAKEVVTSLAIIGDADSNNLKVTGPQTTDGLTPYQLQMDWKVADAKKGDRFYAQVEVGNSADNIGNIGKMAVNLVHTGDDMVLAANKSQAAEGDIVTFSVDMAPNTLGLERSVNMALTLPEGLQLLKDSIKIASNNHDLKDQLVIAGQKLSLSTTQMASNAQKREYKYTTSDDDLSCRIPIGSNPYYLDLFTEAGIEPIPSIQGQANQGVILPLSAFGVDRIPLYNNDPAYMESNTLSISPGGFIQLDSTPLFWPAHYPMEASFFPDTVIAPFWRGDGFILPEFNTETESFDGVSVATTSDRRYLIVEWDNMRQEFAFGINFEPDPNARYSFELLASTELDFAPGEHEIIFAYDKLTGSKGHLGSIGTHGFHGPRGTFGPSYGYIGDSFAFNDIDQKVKEGLVVCGNYFGPEQSAITMTFDARVSAKAVGQTLKLEINSDYTGSNSVTSYTELKVPSNLSISSLPDMQTAENKALSFEVMVRDNQNSANGIEVIGKNITTVVKGNKVTLTPEANWHGETKVSVKVYDLAFNNDAVSTSFNLKVISDGVEPIPPTPEPEPEANRDGGSLGGGLLMLLGLGAAIRRRSSHKKYHS